MECASFDDGRCRSCVLMGVPYAVQLADKDASARQALQSVVPGSAWSPPFASAESGFRNKAKMVVAGPVGQVTLGILDGRRQGVDLQGCGLHEPAIQAALPTLADFIDDLRLLPYDVNRRRGEIKHLHVTASPAGDLMVRFVVRSEQQAPRIRRVLPELLAALPTLHVATLNHLPEHVALLEGEREEILTEATTLPMDLGRLTLHVGPQSFFQTNTAVAIGLYEQAQAWIGEAAPTSLLDLYCGVGGFGLYAAMLTSPPAVRGVEVSPDAVASARHTWASLRDQGRTTGTADFTVGDATTSGLDADCIVVNPPRRGIGADLARAIEASRATTFVYSSCNPATLAADLSMMGSFGVERARVFDMFPQSGHSEVLVLATR